MTASALNLRLRFLLSDTFSKCSGHTLEHVGLKHEPSVRPRRQITKYPVGHNGELNLRLEFFPSTRIVHGNVHSENRLTGDELMKSSVSFFLACSFRGLLSLIVLIAVLIVLTIFVVLDRRFEEKAVVVSNNEMGTLLTRLAERPPLECQGLRLFGQRLP